MISSLQELIIESPWALGMAWADDSGLRCGAGDLGGVFSPRRGAGKVAPGRGGEFVARRQPRLMEHLRSST